MAIPIRKTSNSKDDFQYVQSSMANAYAHCDSGIDAYENGCGARFGRRPGLHPRGENPEGTLGTIGTRPNWPPGLDLLRQVGDHRCSSDIDYESR